MRRPETTEYHPALANYISLVPESDIIATLSSQLAVTKALLASVDAGREGHRYAPGKWSIREVVGHMADGERVFGYRAFVIARGETQPLHSFDEGSYVAASDYDRWPFADLVDAFATQRHANLLVLRSLAEDAWDRQGIANGVSVTPRAIAYALVGHERHHGNVLRERYLETR
ncbi:MAG: DinB family protein [Acidobacteriota bacterium]